MKINCDIGERGADHPTDRRLMQMIDIANIACGGHAGDSHSIATFRQLAEQYGIEYSAHLSYPDRKNFGRKSMSISTEHLLASLDEQLDQLPSVQLVKFHGALYNDSAAEKTLAEPLVAWLATRGIRQLIAPRCSAIATCAKNHNIQLVAEAFADRRYHLSTDGQLRLLPRSHPEAVFNTVEEALDQVHRISYGEVRARSDEPVESTVRLHAETLCIHSDGPLSLPLARALSPRHQSTPPFETTYKGLCSMVGVPMYGNQSIGTPPGGPQDRFAFETTHLLLRSVHKQSLEFIIPPVLRITRSTLLVLAGARFKQSRIERNGQFHRIPHATVFSANPGDLLRFGANTSGLRAYLSWREAGPADHTIVGHTRPPLNSWVTWNEPHGRIRLLAGPEIDRLINPEELTSKPWIIGEKCSAMGMQLASPATPLQTRTFPMISAPVTDGTIQLTPAGPIVLMRQRQTVGGYPRIATVIEVDIDRLAQHRPGEVVRFTWTQLPLARELLQRRNNALRPDSGV